MSADGIDTARGSPPRDGLALDDGHQMARGAAANLLVLFASNFRALFTFLIARILGEAALGRFGLAFATTELLSKVGMLGFDNAIVPFVARSAVSGRRSAIGVVKRTTALAFAASTVVMVFVAGLVWWRRDVPGLEAYSTGGALMLLALPAIAVARIATGASRAVLAMGSEFYSRGLVETWVTTGVFIIAVALGLRDTAPALSVAIGSGAAAIVAYALAVRALRSRIPDNVDAPAARTRPARGAMIDQLRFSLPIAASSLLTVLVMRVDVLLLGAYVNRAPGVTVESFGIFCAAAEVAGGLRKVRQVFDPILAPIVAGRLVASARASLRQTLAPPGRWLLAAQLPLVAVCVLAGGTVMSVYGGAFRVGGPWLAILGLAHGTNAFAGLVETVLMVERPRLNLLNAAATVIVQVVCGLLLIPRLGVMGAALAMFLGFALQGLLRFVEVRYVFGWSWPWASLARPAVAGGVAFLPAAALHLLAPIPWREPVSAATFITLYVAAWFWLGLEPADLEVWRRLFPSRHTSRT